MDRFTSEEAAKITKLIRRVEKLSYDCLKIVRNNEKLKEICNKMEELVDSVEKMRPNRINYDFKDFLVKLKRIKRIKLNKNFLYPEDFRADVDYSEYTEILALPQFQCIVNRFQFDIRNEIQLKKRLKQEQEDLTQNLKILRTKLNILTPKFQHYVNLSFDCC